MDEKRLIEEGINIEENIDIFNVDDLIIRCIKRKEIIWLLFIEFEEKISNEIKEKMELSF